MSVSVLYIHHCGVFGGSSRSLLEIIKAFPEKSVKPYLITQKGITSKIFKDLGIETIETIGISQFDNTKIGYYRGFRWLILLREFFYIFPTLFAIIKAKLKWRKIDIVHINEITMLLPIVLAKLIFKKPVVVHVRSLQQTEKTYIRIRLIKFVLKHFSDDIIAIDETVKTSIPKGLTVDVIHNGFSLELQNLSVGKEKSNLLPQVSRDTLKVGMVGTLLLMKGVYEFIEAARICKEKKYNIHFIFAGDNPRRVKGIKGFILRKFKFVYDVKSDIENLIHKYGMEKIVHLIKFTPNILEIYKNIDILCFPSHLNAVGRPVFEAAFFKIPSIVAITNPMKDTIIDKKTGICIEAKNPKALVDAIEYFYLNPKEIKRMGKSAYKLAMKNFDSKKNALKVLQIYNKLII